MTFTMPDKLKLPFVPHAQAHFLLISGSNATWYGKTTSEVCINLHSNCIFILNSHKWFCTLHIILHHFFT